MHHVYAHAVGRELLFVDEEDFELYLRLAGEVVSEFGWICLSYCLMSNHMHLMIRTPEPNLGAGMQRLHGMYATAFNRRHDRQGHRFDRRYGSRRIKTDVQLKMVAKYIPLNPVTARLCERPEDWPWSSHGPTLAGTALPFVAADELAWFFGTLERYRRFVEAWSGEAEPLRSLDGLGAVSDLELAVDGAGVLLDRVRGEEEA
jgi:REP element-mobilizing transposase RayT